MNLVRALTLGRAFIPDRKVYKYAKLRVNFCLLYMGIALFYIFFDWYNTFYGFIPLYILIILASGICLIVNRLRYFDLANGLMIIFSNVLVYLFADSDDPFGGMFFYFLGAGLVAMILFSYELRYWAFSFVALSIGLGILAFTTDFNLTTLPVIQDDSVIRTTFLINFILATLTCTFIVFFLIKENHRSEKELIRSNEQLEMAVKGTKAGIYEWDLKNNSVSVSAYWRELLGFSERELPQVTFDTFAAFIHPEDAGRINQKIKEVLKSHEPYQIEMRIHTKASGYKWFLDSGIVKVDKAGNAFLVIGSLIDIEDRKKSEKEIILKNNQLTKTNEELDQFVYSASHDMRGPLSSILGLINLAEKTDKVDEFRMYNGMMKERVTVLESFIKQVTDYSRNSRLDLDLSKFSLAQATSEVVNNLAFSRFNKKIKIEVVIDPTLYIVTDSNRVKRILTNLIENAFKFHRDDVHNPYILIKAGQANGQVLVHVEDNGYGISQEYHDRIFEMFYQASESPDGSGLGLYIVKETLQKLGGNISVQSEPSIGSTFTFSLPDLA